MSIDCHLKPIHRSVLFISMYFNRNSSLPATPDRHKATTITLIEFDSMCALRSLHVFMALITINRIGQYLVELVKCRAQCSLSRVRSSLISV